MLFIADLNSNIASEWFLNDPRFKVGEGFWVVCSRY